jgi:hypothetical protein
MEPYEVFDTAEFLALDQVAQQAVRNLVGIGAIDYDGLSRARVILQGMSRRLDDAFSEKLD